MRKEAIMSCFKLWNTQGTQNKAQLIPCMKQGCQPLNSNVNCPFLFKLLLLFYFIDIIIIIVKLLIEYVLIPYRLKSSTMEWNPRIMNGEIQECGWSLFQDSIPAFGWRDWVNLKGQSPQEEGTVTTFLNATGDGHGVLPSRIYRALLQACSYSRWKTEWHADNIRR
jgi:hypothetical protein